MTTQRKEAPNKKNIQVDKNWEINIIYNCYIVHILLGGLILHDEEVPIYDVIGG